MLNIDQILQNANSIDERVSDIDMELEHLHDLEGQREVRESRIKHLGDLFNVGLEPESPFAGDLLGKMEALSPDPEGWPIIAGKARMQARRAGVPPNMNQLKKFIDIAHAMLRRDA